MSTFTVKPDAPQTASFLGAEVLRFQTCEDGANQSMHPATSPDAALILWACNGLKWKSRSCAEGQHQRIRIEEGWTNKPCQCTFVNKPALHFA